MKDLASRKAALQKKREALIIRLDLLKADAARIVTKTADANKSLANIERELETVAEAEKAAAE